MDAHIHFIAPGQIEDALHSGITAMLGRSTGPAHGTLATPCTPGPWHLAGMLQALDAILLAHARQTEDLDRLTDLAVAYAASAERSVEMRDQGAAFASVLQTLTGIPRPALP